MLCNPPGVPAEQISRLEPKHWAWYWRKGYRIRQEPCCTCGIWLPVKYMKAGKREKLSKKAQHKLWTSLQELYYCASHSRRCRDCKATISIEQHMTGGGKCHEHST